MTVRALNLLEASHMQAVPYSNQSWMIYCVKMLEIAVQTNRIAELIDLTFKTNQVKQKWMKFIKSLAEQTSFDNHLNHSC